MTKDQAFMTKDQACMTTDQAGMTKDQACMANDQACMTKDQASLMHVIRPGFRRTAGQGKVLRDSAHDHVDGHRALATSY